MKKLLSIVLTLSVVLLLTGCLNNTSEDDYTWLQLENGACIARDAESGMLYMANEAGELAPYIPDLAVIDDPSLLGVPDSFVPIGDTKTVTPVWLQMENGAPLARDPETGMLYFGNEVGKYAPYLPDLAECESR